MSLNDYLQTMRPTIEAELQAVVRRAGDYQGDDLRHMLAYHMGWEGPGAGPEASGKRVRPVLTLLSAAAAGGAWEDALPAGAAVELVHNFSLIHDDIEDDSPQRRGRPTLWQRWGIPLAINAGDAMFTLAHMALLRLDETASPAITLQAAHILQNTCLHLTQGQHLDISYADRRQLPLEAYWPMVEGKTAALLAACTELGALVGGAQAPRQACYRRFGQALGLAFQAQDDLLGIWGDADQTGKSAESDLLTGKKSLPVLYGLAQKGAFARRWAEGPLTADEVAAAARQLEIEGARRYTLDIANQRTSEALAALEEAQPAPQPGAALVELAQRLLNRQG